MCDIVTLTVEADLRIQMSFIKLNMLFMVTCTRFILIVLFLNKFVSKYIFWSDFYCLLVNVHKCNPYKHQPFEALNST